MAAISCHHERRIAAGVSVIGVHGNLQQELNLKSGNTAGKPTTQHDLFAMWEVYMSLCAYLVKITSAGGSCELLYFIRGSVGDEGQYDELQLHGWMQSGSVLQTLTMQKQPLPEARRQALQLTKMLFQGPHIGDLVLLQCDCQLISGNPPNPQHCHRKVNVRNAYTNDGFSRGALLTAFRFWLNPSVMTIVAWLQDERTLAKFSILLENLTSPMIRRSYEKVLFRNLESQERCCYAGWVTASIY